jgi:hypothetical protein
MPRNVGVPTLSEIQTVILSEITKRRDSPQHLVKRVNIILLAAKHQFDPQIVTQVGLSVKTVRLWRHRWNAQQENFNAIESAIASEESDVDDKALKDFIVNVVLRR